MKIEMSEDGVITIKPESSVEAYALRRWMEVAYISVEDPLRNIRNHIDPRLVCVNADWPSACGESPRGIFTCLEEKS